MSEKKGATVVVDPSRLAEAVAATEHLVHFVTQHPVPEETHKQALLEAIGQMFAANSHALYFDPSSAGVRISIPTANGLHEIISLPLTIGRLVIEAIRRETSLIEDRASGGVHGPFAHGVLRVEQGGVERRLNVDLIPTVYGSAAVLRLMPSLQAGNGDLLALGFSQTQAPVVEALLSGGSGLVLLGGPDRDWVLNTCAVLLSKAALLGRRSVMVASRAGADVAGVARVEAGREPVESASAIARLAAADYSCIGVENFLSEEVARTAASAIEQKALVLGICGGRSAPEAVGQFCALNLPGPINATLALATCQLQIPVLCRQCAKWGDVSNEDIGYFGLDPTKKANFFVRTGCAACNGQVTDFAQVFEMSQITESLREKIRGGMPGTRLEGELMTMPGYTKLLHRFGELIQEGRSSAAEARQYYTWQVPNAPRSGGGGAAQSANLKAV